MRLGDQLGRSRLKIVSVRRVVDKTVTLPASRASTAGVPFSCGMEDLACESRTKEGCWRHKPACTRPSGYEYDRVLVRGIRSKWRTVVAVVGPIGDVLRSRATIFQLDLKFRASSSPLHSLQPICMSYMILVVACIAPAGEGFTSWNNLTMYGVYLRLL